MNVRATAYGPLAGGRSAPRRPEDAADQVAHATPRELRKWDLNFRFEVPFSFFAATRCTWHLIVKIKESIPLQFEAASAFSRAVRRLDKAHGLPSIVAVGDESTLPTASGDKVGDKVQSGRSTVPGRLAN